MSRCVSDLALERYLLDELAADADREHITGCTQCRAELAAKRRAGDVYMRSRDARQLAQRLAPHPRRIALAAIALAAVVLAAIVLWPHRAGDAEAEVLAVEHAWMEAYLHNDVAALDAILADDYRSTDPHGRTITKADDLARTRTLHYDAYDTSNLQVRVWGDTAVITGRSALRGSNAGRTFASEIAFTDTLARIDGRWRAVSAHVSHVR